MLYSRYGYVQLDPTVFNINVYCGFLATLPATAEGVLALAVYSVTDVHATYQANNNPNPGYICIAIPSSVNVPNSFVIGGFTYVMDQTQVTINNVAYDVFNLPSSTFASTVSVQVPPA